MKEILTPLRLSLLFTICLPASLCIGLAGDSNSSPAQPNQTQSTSPASTSSTVPTPVRLPAGAEDVLKLSRAQISEEIILNYVRNSGINYNLYPEDIVYLHNQGVSENVIKAMVATRKPVEQTPSRQVEQAAPSAPAPVFREETPVSNVPEASTVPNAPTVANAPTIPDSSVPAPAPVYVTPPPTPPPAYYVYPYTYYRPYGYYYYPYYYGPSVSFSFGFGGYGYYGHPYHGHGYYGGWHHR